MKTIVTHLSPDLDALTALWLVKRFMPRWEEAEYAFVPVGDTLNGMKPDEDPDIIHVDTGFGKFDHHHTTEYLSAAKLVFEHLKSESCIKQKQLEAVERIVDFVTLIDNFGEVKFPTPDADVYDFALHQLTFCIHAVIPDDHKFVEHMLPILDASLIMLRNKVAAEKDIKEGFVFQSKWGRSIAFESKNEEAVKLALKKGFLVAARKDPKRGFLKIKCFPTKEYDLEPAYNKLKKLDPGAHWALQGSNRIIINGSSRRPDAVPTKLPLTTVIEILKEIT